MGTIARLYSVAPHDAVAGVIETVATIEAAGVVKPIALCIAGVEQRSGPPGAPLVMPSLAEVYDAVDVLKRHLLGLRWPLT
jgi:hypothetical protein